MTTIRQVTQEDFINIATQTLGFQIKPEHIAVVSDREAAKINAVDGNNFLDIVKERGFILPSGPEDIAVVSVVSTAIKSNIHKMKR
jgi:hypothetical protein